MRTLVLRTTIPLYCSGDFHYQQYKFFVDDNFSTDRCCLKPEKKTLLWRVVPSYKRCLLCQCTYPADLIRMPYLHGLPCRLYSMQYTVSRGERIGTVRYLERDDIQAAGTAAVGHHTLGTAVTVQVPNNATITTTESGRQNFPKQNFGGIFHLILRICVKQNW